MEITICFNTWMMFNHTSYLSQTPQTCLCKNFLSGVNFSRLSEKNAYIWLSGQAAVYELMVCSKNALWDFRHQITPQLLSCFLYLSDFMSSPQLANFLVHWQQDFNSLNHELLTFCIICDKNIFETENEMCEWQSKLCGFQKGRWGDVGDKADTSDVGDISDMGDTGEKGDGGRHVGPARKWGENKVRYDEHDMMIIIWRSLYDDHVLETDSQRDRLSENVCLLWS